MTDPKTVHFLLERELRQSAVAGNHPFIAKMALVLESAGFQVEYREHGDTDRDASVYTLSHMRAPAGPRGLVFRRVYEYPFWQIEGTAERWHWDVAKADFDPETVSAAEAAQFYAFWQKRQYQDAPLNTSKDGFIYVPLQGRLAEHRSFQSCSPLEMIEQCIAHNPARQIIATIHPGEHYSEAEIAALEAMEARYPTLRVDVGDMVPLLQRCDYVVTQNSSVAFAGYFFGKPALLFGQIDFHHIAVRADMGNLAHSFAQVAAMQPDFARYLYWFWQENCINAGRDDVYGKITARFRRFGWPID